MDNQRSRHILRALRPHGADLADPDAQDALAAAKADPALGAWLQAEQRFDQLFAEKLQSARPPAELRASIFAAAQGLGTAAPRRRPARIRIHRPVATFMAALAAAASLALVAYLVMPKRSGRVQIDDVISAAAATGAEIDAHDLPGRPIAELRGWFAAKSAPVPGEIPAPLARLQTDGAGVVVLNGVVTSVVTFDAPTFSRDASGSAVARRLSLFTVPRHSCSTAGISRRLSVQEREGRALAVWRDATSIYIVAVDGTKEELGAFMGVPIANLARIDAQPRRPEVSRPEDPHLRSVAEPRCGTRIAVSLVPSPRSRPTST